MRVDNDSHIYDHNFLNHTTMTMKDKLASYNHLIETFVIWAQIWLRLWIWYEKITGDHFYNVI